MTDRTNVPRYQTLLLTNRLLTDMRLLQEFCPEHREEIIAASAIIAALRAQIMAKG